MAIRDRQDAPAKEPQSAAPPSPKLGAPAPEQESAGARMQRALGNQFVQRDPDGSGGAVKAPSTLDANAPGPRPSPKSKVEDDGPAGRFFAPAPASPGRATPSSARVAPRGDGRISEPGEARPRVEGAPAGEPASYPGEAFEPVEAADGERGPELGDAPQPHLPEPKLIVEADGSAPTTEQLSKDAFMDRLEDAVRITAEEALEGTAFSAEGCPYIEYWLRYYRARHGEKLERAIHKFAPETRRATSATEYIPLITERLRRAVDTWVATGRITDVPEGVPIQVPGTSPADAQAALAGGVHRKGRDGAPMVPTNPSAIARELGPGEALPTAVRSRMEAVFDADFSAVRIHTDAAAASLAGRVNARAFALGQHIAFGTGEFRPATVVGDALIAHELAHVLQQQRAAASPASSAPTADTTAEGLLEKDADQAAYGAVTALWSRRGALAGRARTALQSGLQLQRCNRQATPARVSPTVDRITIVDSSAGAISGYPDIVGNADLNAPGPFNDAATGECRNTHQVHFHLDAGDSADLTPTRVVPSATISMAGVTTFTVTNRADGPPPHEIQRPSTDKIVIADSPGILSLSATDYPFVETANFQLTVAAGGSDVARIRYTVQLNKASATDIPNTTNTVTATEKRDLVRNQAIT